MDREYANEILACLPQERTCFHYFKDRYALQLLGYAAGDGISVEALRRSRYKRLLTKPAVRRLLAECGDARLDGRRAHSRWEEPLLPFLLTVGMWGDKRWGYNQTSRPGVNLVLQLNLSQSHQDGFDRLFKPFYGGDSLNWFQGHPVLKPGERRYHRQTLAWARLDLDLERGEALIEEIQTGWVREAYEQRRYLCNACEPRPRTETCRLVQGARRYLDEVLLPYAVVWDEAMLSATLFFLREELGLSRIWYHTWRCGNALKGIGGWSQPPRSVYQRLPQQFCFTETDEMPRMLRNRASEKRLRKARVEPRFHQLDL